MKLLPDDVPTRPRALAVLGGLLSGQVWADDPAEPSWLVVLEDADGTLFAGGDLDADALAEVMAAARTLSGDLIIGFRGPDDPLRAIVPPDPYFVGRAIDFTGRVPPAEEAEMLAQPLPDGVALVDLDVAVLPRTEWADDTIHAFGSVEAWERLGIGRCIVEPDGAVVAQGMAGPRVHELMEMGVWTREDHRGRGLGTLVSLHAAVAAEATGARVWWNTNEDNAPSIAIARRIGFRQERAYDLIAYRTAPG